MENKTYQLLTKEMGISGTILELVNGAQKELKSQFANLNDTL